MAVLVIGVLAIGAIWFLNKAAKPDSMAAPTHAVSATPSVTPSQSPAATPSATPVATPTPSKEPFASSSAAASSGAAQWSKAPTPVEATSEDQGEAYLKPGERTAEDRRLSYRHCADGSLVALAETAKHYLSICDVSGRLFYRGEGKKSGNIMDLPAQRIGYDGFEATTGSGSGKTTYYFDHERLQVVIGSTTQADDPITNYNTWG
ncbi:hypothetical protein E9229_000994 [Paeniglutamicibacter cryotolerans]|uniref:Uncharacterized protein n=1 Tax=Paeniglutamicibacter cryotolerans TaxID=670079 RepID=A0A839QGS1_9MICC|nr:hypothetical protein [Paeniglutamicibacter cryotolerans]